MMGYVSEVFKALNKTRGLYLRWQELAQAAAPPHSPEAEWTSTELKNALRSIEWDLDDLEDTISIVEKNSSKFKIDNKDLTERRKFIDNTRKEVKEMRSTVSRAGGGGRAGGMRPGTPAERWPAPASPNWDASTELASSERPAPRPRVSSYMSPPLTRKLVFSSDDEDSAPLIARWTEPQHEPLRSGAPESARDEAMAASAIRLQQMSAAINEEIAEHHILIEDISAEAESTNSLLDSTNVLSSRVLRFSAGRRQWLAIAVLSLLVFLIILLFILL